MPADESYWGIAVGALDPSGDLEASRHIFVADKASYYDILDDLPQFPGSQRGLGR